MKAALALFLLTSPVYACDWSLSESVDQMTDTRVCHIRSPSANISLFVRDGVITFMTASAYRIGRDALALRIDDNEAIRFTRNHSTDSSFASDSESARQAISEIRQGQRLRVSYLDYPSPQSGDAPICNLPELIDSCLTQSSP